MGRDRQKRTRSDMKIYNQEKWHNRIHSSNPKHLGLVDDDDGINLNFGLTRIKAS